MTYQPDDLDRLLDEALASYSSEEPRPGIEGRILQRVRTAGGAGRSGWWRWAIAIPALACVLIFAMTHRPQRRIFPVAPDAQPAGASAATIEPVHPQPAKGSHRLHRAAGRQVLAGSPLPRRDVFAFPAPLSPGERALMTLSTPLEMPVSNNVVEPPMLGIEPLEIPKIEIAPLSSGSER